MNLQETGRSVEHASGEENRIHRVKRHQTEMNKVHGRQELPHNSRVGKNLYSKICHVAIHQAF